MLEIDILAAKASVQPRLDQPLEDNWSNEVDDMPADNLACGPSFKFNDATIGVDIPVAKPKNIDSLFDLIKHGLIETKCIAFF
jgi:hypothetical protein